MAHIRFAQVSQISDEIQSRLRETDAQQKTKIQMLTERVAQLEKESTDARKKVSTEYPCKYPECPEHFAVFWAHVCIAKVLCCALHVPRRMLYVALSVACCLLHAPRVQDDARVEMVQLQFQQLSSTVRASSLPASILRTSPWSSPPLASTFLPRTVTMLHTRPPARPPARPHTLASTSPTPAVRAQHR